LKILVIWRLLTVGGVNAGWRNRAVYFKQHGIQTEFLYTSDFGGLGIMEGVAPVYITKDKDEILNIINNNGYDAIIVVDTGNAYHWLRQSTFRGPVITEARTPELLKLLPHITDLDGQTPSVTVVPSHYQLRVLSIITEMQRVKVIYNGVDTNTFTVIPPKEVAFDSPPILPFRKKIVCWIGRLDNRKNWSMLLRIAKLVKKERKDIQFWVIGGYQSSQHDLFKQKRKEHNVTDIVKWYPVIPYHEMPHVYAKIRLSGGCTLATTKGESFGNTFIESMACGVPVVAPHLSSIPEIVIHGKTGRLYQENHLRGAARQIYRILDDPAQHKMMSDEAVKRVQKHFEISKCADQYVQLLQSLANRQRDYV
jgi:L-malate glycosyltransferase